MSDVLADAHTALWHLFDPARLSVTAKGALARATQSGGLIQVSAITPIEVRYLVEKSKIPLSHWTGLLAALLDPQVPVNVLPIDLAVAQAVERIPRAIVPDMPDRIIAATSLLHNLPLVTADRKLQAAPIQTIW